LPTNVQFVGINVKWNLQNIFSNKYVIRQREFQLKQAEENTGKR
jgi:outer membrane protein